VAWGFATYKVEFVVAIVKCPWSGGGNSIIAVTWRVVGSTLAIGGVGQCSIVAATSRPHTDAFLAN